MNSPERTRDLSETEHSLGDRALRGTVWGTACAGAGKGAAFVAQILLAWILVPEDFGLVAIALSLAGMSQVLGTGGLHVILIQTQDDRGFQKCAIQAFWMALTVNSAIAMVLILAAPMIAAAYGDDRLVLLIRLVALGCPVDTLALVESAWLSRQLRYNLHNSINLGQQTFRMAGAVLLATLNCGPASLVWPIVPSMLLRVVLVRRFSRRFPLHRPEVRAWLPLWKDTIRLNLNGFLESIRQHGMILVIGSFLSAELTGLYFWGLSLSTQVVYLLAANLNLVLLPTFSKLTNDRHRQLAAFRNTCASMLLVLTPICLIQAVTAGSIIELLFADNWSAAATVIGSMSLALISQPLALVSQSLVLAQGRYTAALAINSIHVAVGLLAAIMGAASGRLDILAVSTAVAMTCGNSLALIIATREFATMLSIARDLWTLLLVSIPSGVLGWWVMNLTSGLGSPLRILAATLTVGSMYVLVSFWLSRSLICELGGRLARLVRTERSLAS